MKDDGKKQCPDCQTTLENSVFALRRPEVSRRTFLKTAGLAAAVAPLGQFARPVLAGQPESPSQTIVWKLFESLTAAQKQAVVLDWSNPRRLRVENNWHVVPQRIGRFFTNDQRSLIDDILKNVTSEQGYDKMMRAMRDDSGGLDRYSACLFGDGQDKLSFMLTGRHQTIRAGAGGENNILAALCSTAMP